MKYAIVFICLLWWFILRMAFGCYIFGKKAECYKAQAEKYYQEACVLSDIVRASIDNGDTLADSMYTDLKINTRLYNVSFKGEELDTLYWCY